MSGRGRLAVITARYGDDVVGGAESVLRRTASELGSRGWKVDVLTTTATDHLSGRPTHPAGRSTDGPLSIERFPARPLDLRTRRRLSHRMAAGEVLSMQDELDWVNADLRSPELFHALLRSAGSYDAVLLGPSTTWMAVAGVQAAGAKSVLWACVHDEPLARFTLTQPLLSGAHLLLQTEPEHALAHRLVDRLGDHAVVGCPVAVPGGYDPDGFRQRHGIDGPFVLYAGRREGAKGWNQLLRAFQRAVDTHALPLNLVTIGSGEVRPPASLADRVIDLGLVSDRDRDDAFAAASACVQPSALEAFSLTVMEAWLAGTLVIANRGGDVVRWHCERSGAGLLYSDDIELGEALDFVARQPQDAAAIAAAGRTYVLDHYQDKAVFDRIEEALLGWAGIE